jgi:hypothetical protein
MIDFIQNETKKIMYKCCDRYSQQKGLNLSEVQLILGLNTGELNEGQDINRYTMCEKYVRKEEYDIMKVLGVKIDFLGYSKLAPPFIFKSLVRFSEQYNIDIDKVCIMCVPDTESKKREVSLFVYNGNQYVETITFEELFRAEDFELPKT